MYILRNYQNLANSSNNKTCFKKQKNFNRVLSEWDFKNLLTDSIKISSTEVDVILNKQK